MVVGVVRALNTGHRPSMSEFSNYIDLLVLLGSQFQLSSRKTTDQPVEKI